MPLFLPTGRLAHAKQIFHPTYQHSAYSATLLFMVAVMLSRMVGYIREAYIAWAFGAGQQTDAYVAAFTLPDFLNYILAGGMTGITFVVIYARYLTHKETSKADRTFSAIVTIMSSVLIGGIIITEIFAPQIVRLMFPRFTPEQMRLCVNLTRILLPAQLFFYVGGVISAVLVSYRMFLLPCLTPIIYNAGIIGGGVMLSHHFGIASLAIGAVGGAALGPFLVNVIGVRTTNVKFAPNFNIADPGFREWIRKTIPFMVGISLVAADDWILRYFASTGAGDITRLNYAKRLFAVPMAVIGQAAGAASLPFFTQVYNEKRRRDFARLVSDSVYRISAVSLLISAWMAAAALPIIDLVYRRGKFTFDDSKETAVFFFCFGLSLAFWSAQAIYSRAFYAAGDTVTPMIASTLITIAAVPIYRLLFSALGMYGLAVASDIGILANTLTFAVLLHRRSLVPGAILRWNELGTSFVVAIAAGLLSYWVGKLIPVTESRPSALERLGLATITWAATVSVGLWMVRSHLLSELIRGNNKRGKGPSTAS